MSLVRSDSGQQNFYESDSQLIGPGSSLHVVTGSARPAPQAIDGRHARRERSRIAVIDAAFELIQSGKIPPSAEDVAQLAGVSVSSIFRIFDGLDDLQRQAVDHFSAKFEHMFAAAPEAGDLRASRVDRFVRIRLDLYEEAGPLMSIGRQRALVYEPMVEAVARNRHALSSQVRTWFASELHGRTPSDAVDLVAIIDALTSPEAFDLMAKTHSRSRIQITRSWGRALDAVIDGWPARNDSTPGSTTRTETSR